VPPTTPAVSTVLNFISITQHCSRAESDGRSLIAALKNSFPKAKVPHSRTEGNFVIAHSSSVFGGLSKHMNLHVIPLPQQKPPQAAGYSRKQVTAPYLAENREALGRKAPRSWP